MKSSDFIKKDDLQYLKAKEDAPTFNGRLSAKIDFEPSKFTRFVIGGNWEYQNYRQL